MLRQIALVCGLAALVARSAAVGTNGMFELSDICAIETNIIYDNDVNDPRSGTFELTKDSTSAEFTLAPGDLEIIINMVSCAAIDPTSTEEDKPEFCREASEAFDTEKCSTWQDGGGLAFQGKSGPVSITGELGEEVKTLNILAVDQGYVTQAASIGDEDFDFPVIITSITTEPSKIKYAQSSAITVRAQSVAGTKTVKGYSITPLTSLDTSSFSHAPSDIVCEDQNVCENVLGFTAVAGTFQDQGNIQFKVSAFNQADEASEVNGNIVIDARGRVQITDTLFLNIPNILTTKSDVEASQDYNSKVYINSEDGPTTSVVELQVQDLDYNTELDESLVPRVSILSPDGVDKRVGTTHQKYKCSDILVPNFQEPTGEGNIATWTLDVDMARHVPEGDLPYGITSCVTEVYFEDNSENQHESAKSPSPSSTYTISFLIFPDLASVDLSVDMVTVPTVKSTLLSPAKAADDEEVVVYVEFEPANADRGMEILLVPGSSENSARENLANSVNVINEAGCNAPGCSSGLFKTDFASADDFGPAVCTTGCKCSDGCRYRFVIPSAENYRNFYIYMKEVGAGPESAVWEAMEIAPDSSARRRRDVKDRRRAAAGSVSQKDITQPITTDIVDGKLVQSLPKEFASKMGAITTTTTTPAPKEPTAGNEADSKESSSDLMVIVGASAGVVVVVIAIVAFALANKAALRKRASAKVTPMVAASTAHDSTGTAETAMANLVKMAKNTASAAHDEAEIETEELFIVDGNAEMIDEEDRSTTTWF